MTVRDTPWPPGTPCWTDLMVADRKAAQAFYGPLFGWEFAEGDAGTGFYTMCLIEGRPVAGIGEFPPDQPQPPAWTTYLAVTDAEATSEAITAAGGTVLMPPMDVLSEGRMAVAADPTGAVFGLWQAGNHYGMRLANQPGTVSWNECMTRDVPRAREFYAAVFGYGFEDYSEPDTPYFLPTIEGRPVGGIGALPADTPDAVPAHWNCCFAIADVDAAVAMIAEMGGTVDTTPEDTPYGRIAMVTDNQGAPLVLMAPNEQSGAPEGWDAEPAPA